MRTFNEIFRKDVAYNNNKTHKKAGFHSLSRKHIFRKNTGDQIDLSSFLWLKIMSICAKNVFIRNVIFKRL